MERKSFTITSALLYANGPIHLGHLAGAYLPADIFARYQKLKGHDVAFICGSDEHGAAITIQAKKDGITPKEIIDKYPEKMHRPILNRFQSGEIVSAPDYVRAWQELTRLRNEFADLIEDCDATIAPTTPILPPNTSALLADDDYFSEQNLLALRNTRLANMMGLPALSLPTSFSFCGLMLMGKPFEDIKLLRLGKAIEEKVLNFKKSSNLM